jgi:trans-aconitate methyltransferase
MNAASRAPRPSVALWVAAGLVVPADVDRRLRAGGAALEIGCGGGVGCLALAEAYPAARILGHDRDPRSIARAAALAEAAGLSARVRFAATNSERLPRAAFDLATLQALSDRADALAVLNAVRNALVPGGVCVAVERPAGLGRPLHGQSLNGARLRTLALQAGFAQFAPVCPERGQNGFENGNQNGNDDGFDVYELRR